jgi:hypothetical protein
MHTDWRSWARAVNQAKAQEDRIQKNFISDWGFITEFEDNWAPDEENPPAWFVLKNGFVCLSGSLTTTAHTVLNTILTLPKAATPVYGHDFGGVPLIVYHVNCITVGGASSVRPIFIGITGTMIGAFTIAASTEVMYLDGITIRAAIPRGA